MKELSLCCLLLTLLSAGATLSWGAPEPTDLQEGLWEMRMESTMTGIPFELPPSVVVVQQCLTAKDFVPKDPNSTCTFNKMNTSGNKATWEADCIQNGTKATSSGEITYSKTSCSGTSKTVITTPDGSSLTAHTIIKGKRLGKCQGEEQSSGSK